MFLNVRRLGRVLYTKADCEKDSTLCAVYGTLVNTRPVDGSKFFELHTHCFLIDDGHALPNPVFDLINVADMCNYNCFLNKVDAHLVATSKLHKLVKLVLRPMDHTPKLEATEKERRVNEKFYKLMIVRLDFTFGVQGELVRTESSALSAMLNTVHNLAKEIICASAQGYTAKDMVPRGVFAQRLFDSFCNSPLPGVEGDVDGWATLASQLLVVCVTYNSAYHKNWLQILHQLYSRGSVVPFWDIPYPLNITLFKSMFRDMNTEKFCTVVNGGDNDFSWGNKEGKLYKAFVAHLCELRDSGCFHIENVHNSKLRVTILKVYEHGDDAEFLEPLKITDVANMSKSEGLQPFAIDRVATAEIDRAFTNDNLSKKLEAAVIEKFVDRARVLGEFWKRTMVV